jgi:nucleoid-associated protein YgaU
MNQYRALMAGFAAVVGLGGVAAYNGVFSGNVSQVEVGSKEISPDQAAQKLVDQPAAGATEAKPATAEPAATEVAKAEPAAAEPSAAETKTNDGASTPEPVEAEAKATLPALVAPTFDVLRVESNGSVVIAGKAGADAQVEVLSGADVLGATKAQANGDFAIAIDNQLKAGDYQLVLRQTLPNGSAATSIETATVSVPEKLNGPVLALVEEPGKPSRIITAPVSSEVSVQAQVSDPATPAVAAPEVEPVKPADPQVVTPATETPAPAAAPEAVADSAVKIEAVETEGNKIFVAGVAKNVGSVRVYANDQILGETKPVEGERFLMEIQKELAVGDYIFKADGLAADGITVLGTSSVPFTRNSDVAMTTPTAPATEPETVTPAAPQSDAAVTPAPAAVADKKMAVIIRRGDTLWQISRRIYGRGVRFSTIYLANKDAINNPNRIFPGQVVSIPDATPEGDTANAEEIKKRESTE